jgi:hypothetical protein
MLAWSRRLALAEEGGDSLVPTTLVRYRAAILAQWTMLNR